MYSKSVNVYVANHGKLDGVDDLLQIIKFAFESRGFLVFVSNEFRVNMFNFIVDEFVDSGRLKELDSFKKHNPQTPVVFVLTEFVGRAFGVTTINPFRLTLLQASLEGFSRLFHRKYMPHLEPLKPVDFLKVIFLYFPFVIAYISGVMLAHTPKLLSGQYIRLVFNAVLTKFSRVYYAQARFQSLKYAAKYADGFIGVHKDIYDGAERYIQALNKSNYLGEIFPEFDLEKVKRSLTAGDMPCRFEVSGKLTPYRKSVIRRLDITLRAMGLHSSFKKTVKRDFGSNPIVKEKSFFALHPPQTKHWPKVSPTRIYRSLTCDASVPVLTCNFGQHPIEELCLLLLQFNVEEILKLSSFYRSEEHRNEWINTKLPIYCKVAFDQNQGLVDRLQKIIVR